MTEKRNKNEIKRNPFSVPFNHCFWVFFPFPKSKTEQTYTKKNFYSVKKPRYKSNLINSFVFLWIKFAVEAQCEKNDCNSYQEEAVYYTQYIINDGIYTFSFVGHVNKLSFFVKKGKRYKFHFFLPICILQFT